MNSMNKNAININTKNKYKMLDLERGPRNLVRTTRYLFDKELGDLIKKVDINRLDGA